MKKLYVKEDKSRRPFDWSKAKFVVFPNLKPSSSTISLRMPNMLLARLKAEAHRQGVPYQSYIKTVLAQSLRD